MTQIEECVKHPYYKKWDDIEDFDFIPESLVSNKELEKMVSKLPKNYDFEIFKTINRIFQLKAKSIALQFPEGLLMFACTLSDIFETFCNVETIILGDSTFGACCIDDYTSFYLGVDLVVHYGHSCLIPVYNCKVKILYIFVEIKLDFEHLISVVKKNFQKNQNFVFVSTIQFANSLRFLKHDLSKLGYNNITIPQVKPLSKGEILGCTAPLLTNIDVILYVGDGRFHIESIMIQNPKVKAYKYDPYNKKITSEKYDNKEMISKRVKEIGKCKNCKKIAVVVSTLGRQGNPKLLERVENVLKKKKKEYIVVMLSEIFPSKLNLLSDVDVFVQLGCPRLSIDWGGSFEKPLLNPYELFVMLEEEELKNHYPMNNYSQNRDEWSNTYEIKQFVRKKKKKKKEILKK